MAFLLLHNYMDFIDTYLIYHNGNRSSSDTFLVNSRSAGQKHII